MKPVTLPPAFALPPHVGREPIGGWTHRVGVTAATADGGGDPYPGDNTIRVSGSRYAANPGPLPPAFLRAVESCQRVPVLKALIQYARFNGGTALGGYRFFVADPDNYTRVTRRRMANARIIDRLLPQQKVSYVAPRYGRNVSDTPEPSYDIRDTGTSIKLRGRYARALRVSQAGQIRGVE